MKLSLQEKIRLACSYAGTTRTEMGRKLGMSQVNTSKRIKTGKFTQEELESIASAIGAEYYCGFRFPDGTKIE